MDDNYYTPEIEEFHIGFEFEYHNGVDKDGNDKWKKTACTKSDFRYLDKDTINKFRRVKYIDKDDLMSLGLIEVPLKDEFGVLLPKHITAYEMLTQTINSLGTDGTLRIVKRNENLILITYKGHQFFSGILNNKSELITQVKRCQIKI